MAQRRMFNKKITETDLFLDMPMSAQCLYFHLNMSADDDGFIGNVKTVKRMIGASDDDLKLLMAKEFIIPFESGVVVIKDWKVHNYIRSDRYNETIYKEEMKVLSNDENGRYITKEPNVIPSVIPTVDERLPQVRLGKDRVIKDISPNESVDSDFDKLWALYPRKEGKKAALKKYNEVIKKGIATNKQIQDGIVAYKRHLKAEGIEAKYIKQGGTYFNGECWNDQYELEKPDNPLEQKFEYF